MLAKSLDKINQLVMVDTAGTNYNHIFSEVVSRVELCDHVPIDHVDIINVTKDGLSHHVLPINVVVHIFH